MSSQHFIFDGVEGDVDDKPLFTVSETAKFFFARSPHWIRWLEGENKMVLDGKVLVPRRTPKGSRAYSLPDIELICHALGQAGALSGAQLSHALLMVQTCAKQWGYLP